MGRVRDAVSAARPKLAALDGLRAVAVLLVLVQHYAPRSGWLDAIGPGGLGVALFFVLSGYLLTNILLDERPPEGGSIAPVLRVFYLRRFLRILPLYWAVLIATAALGVGNARAALPYNALYLSNVYFFSRRAWDGALSPLWSLALEEQFYLLWPTAVLLLARRSVALFTRVAFVLALAGPLFRLALYRGFGADPFALLLPFGYTDQLVWGGWLAGASRCGLDRSRLAMVGSGSCVVLLWMTVAPARAVGELPWLAQWALRPTVVALSALAAVDWARSSHEGPAHRALTAAPLVHIGAVSYGVYLLHPYLHYTAFALTRVPGLRWLEPVMSAWRANGWLWLPLACATAIAAASASWRFFEKPINERRVKLRYPREARR